MPTNTATYLERLLTFFRRAADVTYDNTESGLTATDVQAAIDEVAGGGDPATFTPDFLALNHFGETIATGDPLPLALMSMFGSLPSSKGTSIALEPGDLAAVINESGLYSITFSALGSGADGLSLFLDETEAFSIVSAGPPATVVVPLPAETLVSARVTSGGDWTTSGGNYLTNILTIYRLGPLEPE